MIFDLGQFSNWSKLIGLIWDDSAEQASSQINKSAIIFVFEQIVKILFKRVLVFLKIKQTTLYCIKECGTTYEQECRTTYDTTYETRCL